MSEPDLGRIIQSPEAETFLRMVTEGFYNNSYTGLWMFEVMGQEWDEMRKWATELRSEINPQTCTWSIAVWEWVYGIETDESLPLEVRRSRLRAKAIGLKPINPEIVRRGVAAFLGAADSEVEVNDFVQPYSFEVVIHLSGEKPFSFTDIRAYVREIKPSHLTMYLTNIYENDPAEITLRITPWLAQPMGITKLPEIEPEFPGTTLHVTPILGRGLEITTLPEVEPDIGTAEITARATAAAQSIMETKLPWLEESDTTVMPDLAARLTAAAQSVLETTLPVLEEPLPEDEMEHVLRISAAARLPFIETRLPWLEDFDTRSTAAGTIRATPALHSVMETRLPELEEF